jgi:hypothetical protein
LFRSCLSLLTVVALSLPLLGCPGTQIITETPEVANADSQQATCKVAKDPLNPLIVEWPGTNKVDFDSASQRGVVFVSYVGCNLKVLSSCRATSQGSGYEMTSVTPARDKVVMADQSELYARLPLGAASLRGELGLGSSLELDYIAVGQRIAKEAPRGYEGDCEGVTHFVRTITVGAYSLDARAAGKAAAGADIGNAGGGVSRQESRRNIRGSGNVELCASDPSARECAAVLQLGLAPLAKGDRGQLLNTAGFATGIGPLGTVVVPDLGELNLGNASFRSVDSGYLRTVDEALRAEKDTGISTETKIQKWELARDARPDGEFRRQAEERVAAWREVQVAERQRREKLELLKTRYLQDKQKLDDLLAIQSETLASSDQKGAWKKEFATAYEPYEKELGELGLTGTSSSSSSPSGSGPTSYTPTPDSSSGGGPDVTRAPSIGEEIFVIKGDFGMHAQGFSVDDDVDTLTGAASGDKEQKPDYGLSGFFAGGHLAVNFDSDREMGVGVLAYGRYYVQATLPKELNPTEEATGAFEIGGGLRVSGPLDDRVAMNLGFQGGVVKFLGPETDPTCPTLTADGTSSSTPYDGDALGGNVDLFLGFDFYPLSFLSLGITGLLGWGHVEAQACNPQAQTLAGTTPVLDAFGESFSATGTGHLGFHF